MVQIVTDSSTLITVDEGKAMGIDVLPLCVNIMDEDYRDLQVDMDDFYGKIAKGGVPKSSQPPVGEFVEAFKQHTGKKILNIAMAHGLSGTYQSACGAKEIAENKDDIEVIINKKEDIKAPIKTGDVLGKAVYKCNGEVIGEVNLVAGNDVKRSIVKTIGNFFKDNLVRILLIGILIIILYLYTNHMKRKKRRARRRMQRIEYEKRNRR